jgi:hypothetical protein
MATWTSPDLAQEGLLRNPAPEMRWRLLFTFRPTDED